MKPVYLLSFLILSLVSCTDKQKTESTQDKIPIPFKKYENDLFSLEYPADHTMEEMQLSDKLKRVIFYANDDSSTYTSITWGNDGFPGSYKEFAITMTYVEMLNMEKNDEFYTILNIDSLYLVDDRPTYSLTSLFTEEGDTILQSRSSVLLPDSVNMIIIQRLKPEVTHFKKVLMEVSLIETLKFNKAKTFL